MKKEYDFSNARKNPYAKMLKNQKKAQRLLKLIDKKKGHGI